MHPQAKGQCLLPQMRALGSAGLAYRNHQAVFADVAMAMPSRSSFWLVADYREVNHQLEAVVLRVLATFCWQHIARYRLRVSVCNLDTTLCNPCLLVCRSIKRPHFKDLASAF